MATGCGSRFSRLGDEGLQEWFAGTGIAIANLRRGLAVALAFLLDPAALAEPGTGGLELPHRPAAYHFPQPGLVDVAQNRLAMVARPDIAHRIEGIVGPRSAGRTETKTQMVIDARIHQTRRDRHGTTDAQAGFRGKIIRLPIPELSEERRASLAKQVKHRAEEAKIAIRNIRRDGNELAKKAQKNSEITEDDLKQMLDDIQKLTDDYIAAIEKDLAHKEKELMNV